jgi:hypothetical protein
VHKEISESAEDEVSEQFRMLHNGGLHVQVALFDCGNEIKKVTTGLGSASGDGDKECIQNFDTKATT